MHQGRSGRLCRRTPNSGREAKDNTKQCLQGKAGRNRNLRACTGKHSMSAAAKGDVCLYREHVSIIKSDFASKQQPGMAGRRDTVRVDVCLPSRISLNDMLVRL